MDPFHFSINQLCPQGKCYVSSHSCLPSNHLHKIVLRRQPALKNFFLKGVEYLIHDIAKQHLVKKYGYPENVANIVYDPHFPIRGEWSNKWEDDFHSFALAPFVFCLWLKCADLNRYTFSLYTDLFAHTLCMYLIKYFLLFSVFSTIAQCDVSRVELL